MTDIERDFVHMARLSLTGLSDDVTMMIRKTLPRISKHRPDLTADITQILDRLSNNKATRSIAEPLPVDLDSRLELIRRDFEPCLEIEPVWPASLELIFCEIINERASYTKLREAGVEPTKSLLFKGPPGTGKSLAARWLARQLHYPLLTLDLSAVMSSFLGRTGNNIRVVLDYARRGQSVLLLDEFDAIAKRRDDITEVGELKRLVTVLLQEIEAWPSHSILIAATNHPDLLDPAVWRRFDRVIEFPSPSKREIKKIVENLIPPENFKDVPTSLVAELLYGGSFADVTRSINIARRSAIVRNVDLIEMLVQVAAENYKARGKKEKLSVAAILKTCGLSQRKIANMLALSRDTLRSHLDEEMQP